MIIFTFKERGPVPRVIRKEFNRIKKSAYRHIGNYWHRFFLRKHFTRAGAKEYGYLPRKGESGNPDPFNFKRSYTGRKLKRFGHTNPLVFSGESMRRAMVRIVRSTSRGARVVMKAPAFNFRNKHSNINMREELTRVSRPERQKKVQLFDRFLDRRLEAINKTRTVRIR
ncbi:MAG: hypothetical protein MI923_20380 [Phycisphaerales bacterium]|nr:hypothetical protein [Phycisphaerales bacterium]